MAVLSLLSFFRSAVPNNLPHVALAKIDSMWNAFLDLARITYVLCTLLNGVYGFVIFVCLLLYMESSIVKATYGRLFGTAEKKKNQQA